MILIIRRLGLLFFLILAGCVDLSPIDSPEVELYTLNIPLQSLKPPKQGKTILVLTPSISAAYDTVNMAYRKTPYQISYFTEHRWVASPDRMLVPLIVQTLENTKKFKAVIPAPFSGKLDYRLDTKIIDWYQDFTVQKTSRINIAISAILMDIKRQEILGSTRIMASLPSDPNPKAGVAIINQAIKEILQSLSEFVIDRIESQPKITNSDEVTIKEKKTTRPKKSTAKLTMSMLDSFPLSLRDNTSK